MGREVRRVPLSFDWPLDKVWKGFLRPDKFREDDCPDPQCRNGYSLFAWQLHEMWYGNDNSFTPESTGSTPFTADTPAVRAFAERNIASAPDYYGTGEGPIIREAWRLARLWNKQWSHHLSQEDVDVLLEEDNAHLLRDLTHDFDPAASGPDRWKPKDPQPALTAAEVNDWLLRDPFASASSSLWYACMRARCAKKGEPVECQTCDGHGSVERYEGQRAESEKWEREDPPTGEGWQLWETVSEGSPISPVFPDAEGLARWMASPAYRWGAAKSGPPMPIETARAFVSSGWAPSGVVTSAGYQDGVTFMGELEIKKRQE